MVTVNRELLKKPPLIIFKHKPGKENMDWEITLSNLSVSEGPSNLTLLLALLRVQPYWAAIK